MKTLYPQSSRSSLTLFLVLLFSYGCTVATVGPYGETTLDGEQISAELRHARIPPEAPSISQGYKPGIVTRAGKEDEQADFHFAIDIIETTGTPILAAAPGKIISSYYDPLYGNRVFVSHEGLGEAGYLTIYNHLDSRLETVGKKVKRGQQIGTLGHTGLLSGGLPHLHFEIRKSSTEKKGAGMNVNPHLFWFDGLGIITCFDRTRIYEVEEFKTTYPVPCLETQWRPEH